MANEWTPIWLVAILGFLWWALGPRMRGLLVLAGALMLAGSLFGAGLGFLAAEAHGTGTGIRPARGTSQLARRDIPARYLALYQRTRKCRGLAWYELAAIGKAESDHGRAAGSKRGGSSSAGAQGPMQFMPGTWRTWGRGGDVHKPEHAIPAAARYLCAAGAGRNLTLGAAAYNAGSGAVRKYGGVPPYAETRNYVATVNAWSERYRTGRFS